MRSPIERRLTADTDANRRDNRKVLWQATAQMKLPSASQLIVEPDKISEYLLNPLHRYGAAKERFFTIFGFRADSWQILAEALASTAELMISSERTRPGLVCAISWKEN